VLIEHDAPVRELIEVGRHDLRPVVADVVPAEIVRNDEQNVRPLGSRQGWSFLCMRRTGATTGE